MSFLISLIKPFAYVSLPVIVLRSLANSSPVARYYIRAAIYSSTLATVASCSIAAAASFACVGKQYDVNHFVARVFYALASRLLGIEVEVIEGEEYLQSRPAVLMANHQSMLDILIVGRLMPKQASIVSKESLRFTPLGPFMSMSGTVFIDRGNNSRAIKSLNDAGNLIKRLKVSIWMFPEGTRNMSEKNDMLPLKKGGFHLAINAGIPIVPVIAENYWPIYHKGVFERGTIKVKVLPPIPTVGLTPADVGALAARVRDQMLEALDEISPNQPQNKAREKAEAAPQEQPEQALVDSVATEKEEVPSPSLSSVTATSESPALEISSSSASIASSVASRSTSRASENGAETEEDEGMVLVGRPTRA